jgi:hypothetical protein
MNTNRAQWRCECAGGAEKYTRPVNLWIVILTCFCFFLVFHVWSAGHSVWMWWGNRGRESRKLLHFLEEKNRVHGDAVFRHLYSLFLKKEHFKKSWRLIGGPVKFWICCHLSLAAMSGVTVPLKKRWSMTYSMYAAMFSFIFDDLVWYHPPTHYRPTVTFHKIVSLHMYSMYIVHSTEVRFPTHYPGLRFTNYLYPLAHDRVRKISWLRLPNVWRGTKTSDLGLLWWARILLVPDPGKGVCADPVNGGAIWGKGGPEPQGGNKERQLSPDKGKEKTW